MRRSVGDVAGPSFVGLGYGGLAVKRVGRNRQLMAVLS